MKLLLRPVSTGQQRAGFRKRKSNRRNKRRHCRGQVVHRYQQEAQPD